VYSDCIFSIAAFVVHVFMIVCSLPYYCTCARPSLPHVLVSEEKKSLAKRRNKSTKDSDSDNDGWFNDVPRTSPNSNKKQRVGGSGARVPSAGGGSSGGGSVATGSAPRGGGTKRVAESGADDLGWRMRFSEHMCDSAFRVHLCGSSDM
jgi:hypothetical protein